MITCRYHPHCPASNLPVCLIHENHGVHPICASIFPLDQLKCEICTKIAKWNLENLAKKPPQATHHNLSKIVPPYPSFPQLAVSWGLQQSCEALKLRRTAISPQNGDISLEKLKEAVLIFDERRSISPVSDPNFGYIVFQQAMLAKNPLAILECFEKRDPLEELSFKKRTIFLRFILSMVDALSSNNKDLIHFIAQEIEEKLNWLQPQIAIKLHERANAISSTSELLSLTENQKILYSNLLKEREVSKFVILMLNYIQQENKVLISATLEQIQKKAFIPIFNQPRYAREVLNAIVELPDPFAILDCFQQIPLFDSLPYKEQLQYYDAIMKQIIPQLLKKSLLEENPLTALAPFKRTNPFAFIKDPASRIFLCRWILMLTEAHQTQNYNLLFVLAQQIDGHNDYLIHFHNNPLSLFQPTLNIPFLADALRAKANSMATTAPLPLTQDEQSILAELQHMLAHDLSQ
jgi:hypothetical protein